MVDLRVNAHYKEALSTKKRYVLLYGGRGSGKSYFVAQKFILLALQPQYFRGVMVREILGDIRDSQFTEIKDILEETDLINQFEINETSMKFTHVGTGNRIISKGFKKSKGGQTGKFKSIKDPTHVWIEEADEVAKDDFIKADTSLRTTKAETVQLFLTFNPERDIHETHWIEERWFGEKEDPNALIIHGTYKNNEKNLKPKSVEQLEGMYEHDPYYFDVYVNGIWGQKKVNRPFSFQFDRDAHTSLSAQFDPRKRLYMSIDFNIDPFGAIFFHIWKDDLGEHCHIFDEISVPNANLQDMADRILVRYAAQIATMEITGDAMGKNRRLQDSDNNSLFISLGNLLGIRPQQMNTPPNPHHKESRDDTNYFLYHFNDFKINPANCPNTCREMEITEVDTYGQIIKKDRKKAAERADFLDCVRYLINTYFYKWSKHHKGNLYKTKQLV